ncbi:hypothetical protein RB623_17085 [Mesorhizobium sp. LHD-90]|uniref:hypothetical protein n=1 Tax=Mesorhizobium sp. LHD-90 TaxID=3071414 RepID=UPI0027DF370A|nr:hypothetical protein [Mesorhizobium sp. LHD-90]MDQ6435772.1 hypothetical protein [Mesorhizobium sp. LHD-90]
MIGVPAGETAQKYARGFGEGDKILSADVFSQGTGKAGSAKATAWRCLLAGNRENFLDEEKSHPPFSTARQTFADT